MSDSLLSFETALKGFSKDNESLLHEAGEKNSYAYFSMKFCCMNTAGHIGVQINLEENGSTNHRPEEKSRIIRELQVEPNAIDNFQKELIQLAVNQEGNAILYGFNN